MSDTQDNSNIGKSGAQASQDTEKASTDKDSKKIDYNIVIPFDLNNYRDRDKFWGNVLKEIYDQTTKRPAKFTRLFRAGYESIVSYVARADHSLTDRNTSIPQGFLSSRRNIQERFFDHDISELAAFIPLFLAHKKRRLIITLDHQEKLDAKKAKEFKEDILPHLDDLENVFIIIPDKMAKEMKVSSKEGWQNIKIIPPGGSVIDVVSKIQDEPKFSPELKSKLRDIQWLKPSKLAKDAMRWAFSLIPVIGLSIGAYKLADELLSKPDNLKEEVQGLDFRENFSSGAFRSDWDRTALIDKNTESYTVLLLKDCEYEGISFNAHSSVEIYIKTGSLKSFTLAESYEAADLIFEKGTKVVLTEKGDLLEATLGKDPQIVQNYPCAGGTLIQFHGNGTLKQFTLFQDYNVNGYLLKSGTKINLDHLGQITEADLREEQPILDVSFPRMTKLKFDKKKLSSASLYYATNIHGYDLSENIEIMFEDGLMKEVHTNMDGASFRGVLFPRETKINIELVKNEANETRYTGNYYAVLGEMYAIKTKNLKDGLIVSKNATVNFLENELVSADDIMGQGVWSEGLQRYVSCLGPISFIGKNLGSCQAAEEVQDTIVSGMINFNEDGSISSVRPAAETSMNGLTCIKDGMMSFYPNGNMRVFGALAEDCMYEGVLLKKGMGLYFNEAGHLERIDGAEEPMISFEEYARSQR